MYTEEEVIQKKIEVLEALEANKCIVGISIKEVGVSSAMFNQWKREDQVFADDIADIRERAIDAVELKLHELIDGVQVWGKNGVYQEPPNPRMIELFLSTQATDRGYNPKLTLAGDKGKETGAMLVFTPYELITEEQKEVLKIG